MMAILNSQTDSMQLKVKILFALKTVKYIFYAGLA